ncbi:MAG: alkaline phosphatase family protein [Proteobacteria bacterium]|nr:alkaline phosphatase family protein [Pseudomonadota bacterium]
MVIGLDSFDMPLAESFMQEGLMPNLARLKTQSACCKVQDGHEKYSGLAWEYFSTSMHPANGGRWSPLEFNPDTYEIQQRPVQIAPFLAELAARTVVFDVPYCDITQAEKVQGLTRWGAHDPGVPEQSRPANLRSEIARRFGAYPALKDIYGFCWPSAKRTRELSDRLARAATLRGKVMRWMLEEKFPDWELGVVVVGESHSAIEPLWHGVDPTHPLYSIPSGPEAAKGLRKIYNAIDGLIGELQSAFPDATLAVFSSHGMGANHADVAAMALLAELTYRWQFNEPYMRPRKWSKTLPNGIPLLNENDRWHDSIVPMVPYPPEGEPGGKWNCSWMPVTRYARFWPKMKAFAIPSYYDGRLRINLQGREAQGVVPREEYERVRDTLMADLKNLRNSATGEKAVADIWCPKSDDPLGIGPTEADLYVIWQGNPYGLACPKAGEVGPLPCRRPGGHTGKFGFLYLHGKEVRAGDYGVASSFEVVPTLLDLMGEKRPAQVHGNSLWPQMRMRVEKAA